MTQRSPAVEEKLRILVVEDDPVYAEFVAGTLRESGHSADIAGDGATARAMATALQPDAVILDLGLPDESGYDLSRALRNGVLPPSSIIIVLTANLYPQRDVADAVGVDMVLSKPVEPRLVSGMVDLVLERRRRRLRT
jgi:two-component system, OmpR family, response regulator